MKENMELINQIAELRKEVVLLNSKLRNQDCKPFPTMYKAKLAALQQTQEVAGGTTDIAQTLTQNQLASRESFENTQIQMQDLQIKRQYIEELRKKMNILIEENRYLKAEIAAAAQIDDQ